MNCHNTVVYTYRLAIYISLDIKWRWLTPVSFLGRDCTDLNGGENGDSDVAEGCVEVVGLFYGRDCTDGIVVLPIANC